MAAVTPVTKGTAGYCPPGSIFINQAAAAPNTLTYGKLARTAGLQLKRFYFADADNAELWTTPPAGAVAFAYQELANSGSSATSVTMNASRQPVVSSATSNATGYLYVWSRGAKSRATGTNVPPVSKGTSGFVSPDCALLRTQHDNGATDPLDVDQSPPFALAAKGHYMSTSHESLTHRALYFTGVDASANDTWTPNARLLPRVVDYAWQPVATAADRAQVALTNTTVTFFGDANVDGWLHLWFRG